MPQCNQVFTWSKKKRPLESFYEGDIIPKGHIWQWILFRRGRAIHSHSVCGLWLVKWSQKYEINNWFPGLFGYSLMSWASKKQKRVTLSSTEAEFLALCDVTRKLLWLQPLVEEYKISYAKADTLIFEGNIPTINLANNEHTKGRTTYWQLCHCCCFINKVFVQSLFSKA